MKKVIFDDRELFEFLFGILKTKEKEDTEKKLNKEDVNKENSV